MLYWTMIIVYSSLIILMKNKNSKPNNKKTIKKQTADKRKEKWPSSENPFKLPLNLFSHRQWSLAHCTIWLPPFCIVHQQKQITECMDTKKNNIWINEANRWFFKTVDLALFAASPTTTPLLSVCCLFSPNICVFLRFAFFCCLHNAIVHSKRIRNIHQSNWM